MVGSEGNKLYNSCPQPSLIAGYGVMGISCDHRKEHSSQEGSIAKGVNKRRSKTDPTGGQELDSMTSRCHGRTKGDQLVNSEGHPGVLAILVILRLTELWH